jgi:predicted Zn finger-like uncharacterized protein
MILTCPSCETQYFADDSTIGDSGRSVKCAACAHTWHVHAEGVISREPVEIAAGGAHEAYRLRLRERRQRQSNLTAASVWLIMAILFVALLSSAVIFRNKVVNIWPESAQAFKLAGLDVNRFGLDFADIDAKRTFEGTMPILVISGSVSNVSDRNQPGSDVRVGLLDEHGVEVADVLAPLDVDALAPGQMAQFETRLENPPVEAFELELSFIRADGTASAGSHNSAHVNAAETE